MYQSIKKQISASPQGVWSLFFIQVFSTIGFAVLYSTLTLYITGKLGISGASSGMIMGSFVAFNFGLHVVGGSVGGRLLSNRVLFVVGMLLQVVGIYILSFETHEALFKGLALFLTGSGLNVTCINMMITQRFKPEDLRRESAFFYNYSGMNAGFFLGFAVAGHYQLIQDYHTLFLVASAGSLIACVLAFIFWRRIGDLDTILTQCGRYQFLVRNIIGLLIIFGVAFLLSHLLLHSKESNEVIFILAAAIFSYIVYLALRHESLQLRKRFKAYIILALGLLVFWAPYQLAPMGLSLFAQYNTHLQIFGIKIAPQWLQNVNTVVIVIGGPLITIFFKKIREKGIRFDVPLQFALALICIGIGFGLLPVGLHFADSAGYVSVNWLVWSYVIQSIGELLISPVSYSMIGALVPRHYQGLLLGFGMLTAGVAGILSGYFTTIMEGNGGSYDPLVTDGHYSQVFLWLFGGAVAAGIILLILVPVLRRFMSEKV